MPHYTLTNTQVHFSPLSISQHPSSRTEPTNNSTTHHPLGSKLESYRTIAKGILKDQRDESRGYELPYPHPDH